jgi:2-polyprenyl-6-methoxyphenol hydroxylase-like FAD-dependent oxidoreductase
MISSQVLIVGAGPTGLMMALNLYRHRVPFRLVDKKKGITRYSKALGMHARTLEVFRDLQLDQKMLQHGNPIRTLGFYQGDRPIAAAKFGGLETEYPYILGIAQSETETVIAEMLKEKGIHVEWETEVIGIEDKGHQVEATFSKQGIHSQESYAWVIGCDGLHGVVRDQVDIPFVGVVNEEMFAIGDVKIDKGFDRHEARAIISKNGIGMSLILPFGKDQTRIVIDQCTLPPHTAPSLEYINTHLQKRVRADMVVTDLTWASVFHIEYKQAQSFSKGRCFLAGDSAHVHSPIGGQGMNTGLQDAYNLGWKLALVYHGQAHLSLLNTYQEERGKNAKRLLRVTHMMTRIGSTTSPMVRFLRPHIIRRVFSCKKIHDKIVFKMSQLQVHYRKMTLSRESFFFPWSRYGIAFRKAPRSGERVVDQQVQVVSHPEYGTLSDYLRGTHFSLIVFLTDSYRKNKKELRQLHQLTEEYPQLKKGLVVRSPQDAPEEPWSGEILVDASGKLHERYGALRPCMYLVRPDKYIGMRSLCMKSRYVKNYLKHIFK